LSFIAFNMSTRIRCIWFCIFACLLPFHCSPQSRAANYIVSPGESLQSVINSAKPGDVITLRGGTYRQPMIDVRSSGAKDAPITIQGAPGEKVVLKGSRVVTNWLQHDKVHSIWKLGNWKINSQQLFCDGKPLQQIGVQNRWNTEIAFDNYVCLPPQGKDLSDLSSTQFATKYSGGAFFYDKNSATLYARLPQNANPNRKLMEASTEMAVLRGHMASYVHLKNLTLSHCNGTADGLRHGVLWIGGQGWNVEDCTISWGDAGGVHLIGENHTLRNCRIENNGFVGIDVLGANEASNWDRYTTRTSQNLLFENLTLTGNNYRRAFDQWHAGGAKIIPGVRGATFRGCTVKNNLGAGLWFDTDWGDNLVENNLVDGNTCGIWWEISETLPGDRHGIIIRNNRVLNSRDQGIYVSAASEAIIENNTCHNNNFDIVLHGMPRVAYGYPFMLKNNIVRRNIVAGRTADIVVFEGENARLNVVEENFYALPKNEDPKRNGAGVAFSATSAGYDVTHRDLKALWQQKGYERTASTGDPLWQNAANGDYRLLPSSPAQGKGWQPN
jgi:parallel beta-helix repeat protein